VAVALRAIPIADAALKMALSAQPRSEARILTRGTAGFADKQFVSALQPRPAAVASQDKLLRHAAHDYIVEMVKGSSFFSVFLGFLFGV
jgi:hypothetical protein